MRIRIGRFKLELSATERSLDQLAMADFALRRGLDEIAVLVFMGVLLGLGFLSALLGALGTGEAARFWESLLGGIVLLALMTIPIWFVQRWLATARPAYTPERVRALRRLRFALLGLWLYVLCVAVLGLAINVQTNASLEATLAVAMLIAYVAGWGALLLVTFRKSAARLALPRRRWLILRSR